MAFRVLFVCTGNICRSPAGHAVLAARLAAGAAPGVTVDSCGLGDWHAGDLPDPRARAEGAKRGYTLDHPARMLRDADFAVPGLIVAMDRSHLRGVRAWAPHAFDPAGVVLFRQFDPGAPPDAEVDDPYYGPPAGFAAMFDTIERTMPGLLAHVVRTAGAAPGPAAPATPDGDPR